LKSRFPNLQSKKPQTHQELADSIIVFQLFSTH